MKLNLKKTLKKLLPKKKLSRKRKVKNSKNENIKKTQNTKPEIITVKHCKTEEELKFKEGHFYEPKDFKKIVSTNCDVYAIDENGNKFCLLKLRKGVIPDEISIFAYEALEKQAEEDSATRPSHGHVTGCNYSICLLLEHFSQDRHSWGII